MTDEKKRKKPRGDESGLVMITTPRLYLDLETIKKTLDMFRQRIQNIVTTRADRKKMMSSRSKKKFRSLIKLNSRKKFFDKKQGRRINLNRDGFSGREIIRN